jgi:hypothetical protein
VLRACHDEVLHSEQWRWYFFDRDFILADSTGTAPLVQTGDVVKTLRRKFLEYLLVLRWVQLIIASQGQLLAPSLLNTSHRNLQAYAKY